MKLIPEYLTSSLRMVRELSTQRGQQIMDRHASEIKERLTNAPSGSLTVMVCAKNEADSLPRLAFALSRQTRPVRLIVVNNGSGDETEKVAEQLGATVVNQPEGNLFTALSRGFSYLRDLYPNGGVALYTDSDCMPNSKWAETMMSALNRINNPEGQVFGPVFFMARGR